MVCSETLTDELDVARLELPLGLITECDRSDLRALDVSVCPLLLLFGRGSAYGGLRLRRREVDTGGGHDGRSKIDVAEYRVKTESSRCSSKDADRS